MTRLVDEERIVTLLDTLHALPENSEAAPNALRKRSSNSWIDTFARSLSPSSSPGSERLRAKGERLGTPP